MMPTMARATVAPMAVPAIVAMGMPNLSSEVSLADGPADGPTDGPTDDVNPLLPEEDVRHCTSPLIICFFPRSLKSSQTLALLLEVSTSAFPPTSLRLDNPTLTLLLVAYLCMR